MSMNLVMQLREDVPTHSTDTATMSYWLRDALKTAKQRDPIDAVNDAEYLLETLKEFYGIK